MHPQRSRRGNVSLEYILLGSLVAGVAFTAFVIPRAMAGMMEITASSMDAGGIERSAVPTATGPTSTGGEDDGTTGGGGGTTVLPPSDGGGDDWGDDAWDGDDGTGCNQGLGNGAEGCDPGNSNQGDPTNSNDEPDGTGKSNTNSG